MTPIAGILRRKPPPPAPRRAGRVGWGAPPSPIGHIERTPGPCDWDSLIIDHPDKETTRTIALSYSDSIRNGWIGRQLPRLFREQGLAVISIDPVQVFVHYALAELFLGSHLTQLQAY